MFNVRWAKLDEYFRFGIVLCCRTTVPIKKGEEIFVNYDPKMKSAQKWYHDLYKKFAKENPSSLHSGGSNAAEGSRQVPD